MPGLSRSKYNLYFLPYSIMWVKLALLSCMGTLINLVHTFITTFNSYFSSHRSYKVKGGLPVKKFWKKYSSSDNLICFYALCKKKKVQCNC